MATLSMVWIWPGMGWADEPWGGLDGESPEVDSLARSSVRIAAAFSDRLQERAISTRSSEVRFFGGLSDSPDMSVTVVERHTEGFETGHIRVPSGFHFLAPDVRAELIAEALELGVARLVELAGSDPSDVHDAMAEVRSAAYQFHWKGPSKSSPDRKRRVSLEGELFDDGYGRLRAILEVVGNGNEIISEPIRSECSKFAFQRAAKSLRWVGSNKVEFWNGGRLRHAAIASVDAQTGQLSSSAELVTPLANAGDRAQAGVIPNVVLQGPPAVEIGSGFSFGNAAESASASPYVTETARIHEFISTDAAWVEWWVSTGMKEVWIPVWGEGTEAKVTVRVTGTKLTGTRVRPVSSLPDDVSAAIELARNDFESLFERVRARFELGSHPATPV